MIKKYTLMECKVKEIEFSANEYRKKIYITLIIETNVASMTITEGSYFYIEGLKKRNILGIMINKKFICNNNSNQYGDIRYELRDCHSINQIEEMLPAFKAGTKVIFYLWET